MSKEDRPLNAAKVRKPMRHASRGLITQGVNVIKETFNRFFGLPDAIGLLVGYMPVKKIRIRVVILRDEQGVPLAEPHEVDRCWQAMEEVFRREARVQVIPLEPRIITLPKAAPTEALTCIVRMEHGRKIATSPGTTSARTQRIPPGASLQGMPHR